MSDAVPNTTHQWRVRLFGALEVEKPTGEKVALSGRKAGELLAYLALYPQKAHSRDKLIALLWGDSEVSDIRTRLRQEILKLRGLSPAGSDSTSLLHVTPHELQIQANVTTDAVRFLEACAEARQENDWERKKQLYAELRSLYRAELLEEYDAHWIAAERVRFSQCYEQALHDCAEAHRQHLDYAGAEKALQCLLAHNSLNEEGHVALMQLYAEQGLPTRVQQQYHGLERALLDAGEKTSTENTRQLAETLRERAGRRVALLAMPEFDAPIREESGSQEPGLFDPDSKQETSLSAPTAGLHCDPSLPATDRRHARVLWMLLVMSGIVACISFWKLSRHTPSLSTPLPTALTRNQEKWMFPYQFREQESEIANAEGRSIAVDDKSIYVTGQIQTQHEDVDILTLKLSLNGKLLRAQTYHSLEHDCDRGLSVCVDAQGSVYVAGETYVPEHPGSPGGWHLTLLRYDTNLILQWAKRSPLPTKHGDDNIQVSSDRQGGCYIGGTALVEGKEAALLMRYDRSGGVIWQKTLQEGIRTTFSRLVVNAEGLLYFCGTAQREEGRNGVNEDWMIACLNPAGKVAWKRLEDGGAHGSDTASRIARDRAGNVLVAGVFDTGDTGQGRLGMKLAVIKFSCDGTRLWQRMVKDSGPAVTLEGLSLNSNGDLAIGGTEQRPDGNWDILLARYDSFGNLSHTWRYTPPAGYRCATIHAPILEGNGEVKIVGQLSKCSADALSEQSSLLFARYSPEGRLLQQSLFDTGSYVHTIAYDVNTEIGTIVTGQANLSNGQCLLTVLHY